MAYRSRRTETTDVVIVQKRIENWRQTRPKIGPMPKRLWQASVQLARRYGVSRISRVLNVQYRALKNRMEQEPEGSSSPGPTFVEVTLSRPGISGECVVEMERPDGGRMTVRRPDHRDLATLCTTFWGWRA